MWFEENEQYTRKQALPAEFLNQPELSLVRVYPNGKTQPGWGSPTFVDQQAKGAFRPERALRFHTKYEMPFGIVMRSLPMICIDIDGKNGGIATARAMNLPQTLGERSKSGNGYHLFYALPDSIWNPERGYDEFSDIIGLVPGVDIKATGIVFHYGHQQWNNKPIAILPLPLAEQLGYARDVKRQARVTREGSNNLDPEELLFLHDELKTKLAGRFRPGNRNERLYAIGAQMLAANYPAWDIALYDRGTELGLEMEELTELVKNIERYS